MKNFFVLIILVVLSNHLSAQKHINPNKLISSFTKRNNDSINKLDLKYRNKLGLIMLPLFSQHSVGFTYQYRLWKRWSIGVDLITTYEPYQTDYYYSDKVNFKTSLVTLNPFVGFHFRLDENHIKDIFVPKMITCKSTTMFLTAGNNDVKVLDAYEFVLANVVNLDHWYFKLDYGFKHITSSQKITVGTETTRFRKQIKPSVGIYAGIRF